MPGHGRPTSTRDPHTRRRARGLRLGALASCGLGLLGLPATARAQVSAGCSAFPTELRRVEGEPGAISLRFSYQNPTDQSVTFTTTTRASVFTGPESSSETTLGPGLGQVSEPAVQTALLPPGRDTVLIEFRSSATGDAVIGSCQYTLAILPADADADGDALLDSWEQNGIDLDLDGTPDVALPGADSQRRDLFVEVDCLVTDGNGDGDLGDAVDHSQCPVEDAIADVVRAFAAAPVTNPDGTSGIQLHVDTGPLYGAGRVVDIGPANCGGGGCVTGSYGDLGGGGDQIPETGNGQIDFAPPAGDSRTDFYALKATYFDADRAEAFRYAIFANQIDAGCRGGRAEGNGGNDLLVTLGGTAGDPAGPCWATDPNGFSVGRRADQAGTLMHELGHTLGLGHGGGDGVNRKPNYLSVMRYGFQMCGVPPSAIDGLPGGCDYSRVDLPDLDETSLDECIGIGGGLAFGSMDWDGDGTFEGISNCAPPNATNVAAEINDDDVCVAAGSDVTIETAQARDDVVGIDIFGDPALLDGANFTCDSTAAASDTQQRGVGEVQPNPLTGYEDWSNLAYNFRTLLVYADGVAAPVEDEADPSIIEEERRRLRERLAPALVVEKAGPAEAKPGDTLDYTVRVRNVGRGPALGVILRDTRPDGSVVLHELGIIAAGAEVVITSTFLLPITAGAGTLTNSVLVEWVDLTGAPDSATDQVETRVVGRLNVTSLRIAVARVPGRGSIRIKGDFLTFPPADQFSVVSGLQARVQDVLGLAEEQAWDPADCRVSQSGQVRCKGASGRRGEAKFKPFRQSPGLYRFELKFRDRDIMVPFLQPLTVTVGDGALVRGGSIEDCKAARNAGLTCAQP